MTIRGGTSDTYFFPNDQAPGSLYPTPGLCYTQRAAQATVAVAAVLSGGSQERAQALLWGLLP